MSASLSAEEISPRADGLPASVYLHVPFCKHRCGYCDFTLVAGRDDLIPRFLAALKQDLGLPRHQPLRTLYLGGGTPTQLAASDLDQLFQTLASVFVWRPDAEVTVEANPMDLSQQGRLDSLMRAGVNRISLGVQSFDAKVLQVLERDHTPEIVDSVVEHVRQAIPNLSIDLMFGVPGQTLQSWLETLRHAIDLRVPHISTYGLTFETGAAFETRRRRGQIIPIDSEIEREMYALAIAELTSAGYEHYEISNFARPEYRSRHNQVYWTGEPYLAYGPGASSYLEGARSTNVRSVLGWLSRVEQHASPIAECERLTGPHRAREFIFLGLRRVIEGVSRRELREQTGCDLDSLAPAAIAENMARGWLEDDGERIRLTPEGRFFADRVAADFL